MKHSLALVFVYFSRLGQVAFAREPATASPDSISPSVISHSCSWSWPVYYPAQSGPTCTVYTSLPTIDRATVDCAVCTVTNIPVYYHGPITCTTTTTASTHCTLCSLACSHRTPAMLLSQPTQSSAQLPRLQVLHPKGRRQAPVANDTSVVSLATAGPSLTSNQSTALLGEIALALDVVRTVVLGQNLTTLCIDLSTSNLTSTSDVGVATGTSLRSIICSLAMVEKPYVLSTADRLADLAAAFAIIEVGAAEVGTTDLNTLCQTIDFPSLALFRINWRTLQQFICEASQSFSPVLPGTFHKPLPQAPTTPSTSTPSSMALSSMEPVPTTGSTSTLSPVASPALSPVETTIPTRSSLDTQTWTEAATTSPPYTNVTTSRATSGLQTSQNLNPSSLMRPVSMIVATEVPLLSPGSFHGSVSPVVLAAPMETLTDWAIVATEIVPEATQTTLRFPPRPKQPRAESEYSNIRAYGDTFILNRYSGE